MRKIFVILIFATLIMSSCHKEEITTATNASNTLYVDNDGASLRVLVEGNTASKTFLLFVHGGPGTSSYFFNTDYISSHLEDKYAMVYWDQRNTGGSQGNNNGDQLNLDQYVKDLKKVIQVLKYRWGQDINVVILGHSWGGMITSKFVVTDDNQNMVKGWICMDGNHNFKLNDQLTRQKLQTTGEEQIALGKHIIEWEEIVNYCKAHPGDIGFEVSNTLNGYAADAENYIDDIVPYDPYQFLKDKAIKDKYPVIPMILNHGYSSNANFNKDLLEAESSSQLYKVTIPVMTMYGKYDFICPSGLGEDIYSKVSSALKSSIIFEKSGHNGVFQQSDVFCQEVSNFLDSL